MLVIVLCLSLFFSSAVHCQQWWRPQAGLSWQWILSGPLDSSFDVQVYDVDLFERTSAEITALHAAGKAVICYVSSQYENNRPDSGQFPPATLGAGLDGWPGERWVDIRDQTVRNILAARASIAKSKGCDGIEWDNVDQDSQSYSTGFPLTFEDTKDFLKFLSDTTHALGLAVFLKNNAEADRLLAVASMFDGAVNEQCFQYNECGAYKQAFTDQNKPVFVAEYTDEGASKSTGLCQQAAGLNVDVIFKTLDLKATPYDTCQPRPTNGYWQSVTGGQQAGVQTGGANPVDPIAAGLALLNPSGDICNPGTGNGRCVETSTCDGVIAGYKSYPLIGPCRKYPSASVQCCAPDVSPSGGQPDPQGADPIAAGFALLNPSGDICNPGTGNGRCVEKSTCDGVIAGYKAYPSIGACRKYPSASIQCCAPIASSGSSGSSSGSVSSGVGECAPYGGLLFPLAPGSLKEISANWGFARQGGKRCHAGIDIYTNGRSGASVVAMADGVITEVINGWYGCSGGSIDAILVYHSSGPLQGKTVNYGEMNPGHGKRAGQTVRQGDVLGQATRCGMLHFELYAGRRTSTSRWYPASGSVGAGCAKTSMRTKPSELLDPRPLLDCTKPNDANFRHGSSFLEDGDDSSLYAADAEEEVYDDEGGLSAGEIAAIVVAVLVVVAAAVFAVVFFRRRGARGAVHVEANTSTIEFQPSSEASTANAAGAYACAQCGKSYDYAEDLSEHVALRH